MKRVASYSHEYIGSDPNLYETVMRNTESRDTAQLLLFNDAVADAE
jgi:hypothetical protein